MSSIHRYENKGVASRKCQTFTFRSGSFFNRCCLGHFPPTAGCPAALVGGTGGAGTGGVFAAVFPPLFPTLAVFFVCAIFQMKSHQFLNFATAHVFWWCHTHCTNYVLCFYMPGTALDLVSMRNSSCAVFGGNSKSELHWESVDRD